MPFQIVRNDIVNMQVDAIVNAANEKLMRGGGVCGAIFAAAGMGELQAACDAIGHCDTGSAVVTPGFALPARHVIHAVGPVWRGGSHGEEAALRGCYQSSLRLAHDLGDQSIAFPLISSGIYGYPKEQALDVAISEIRAFLNDYEMDVYLIVFDAQALRASQGRFFHVAQYIDDLYVRQSPFARRSQREGLYSNEPIAVDDADALFDHSDSPAGSYQEEPRHTYGAAPDSRPMPSAPHSASYHPPASASPRGRTGAGSRERSRQPGFLRRLLKNLDAGFSATLMRMIDERGLKDSEVYKRANMSRQHFSKIRSNPNYQPKKQTVLALAVALELSLDDTRLLLERAGFALTHADVRDVIVEYYIQQKDYDIYNINLALYAFDQPLLG